MKNEVLRRRITNAMAVSYTMNPEDIWSAYQRLNDLEKVLNLLETNKLQEILKELN
ncbi:MAG: hypothetical protein ACTSWR_12310 [Candidatus Helarchaeota archaeon]